MYQSQSRRIAKSEGSNKEASEHLRKILNERGLQPILRERFALTPISLMYWIGWDKILRFIVENTPYLSHRDSGYFDSPLHAAVKEKNREMLKWMIHKNMVRINAQDTKGRTPLYVAVSMENVGITSILLENSANLKITDKMGLNVIHMASRCNSKVMIRTILKYCSEELINIPSTDYKTPLHYLVENTRIDESLVKLYLQKGANINSRGNPWKYSLQSEKRLQEKWHFRYFGFDDWMGWTPLFAFINNKVKGRQLIEMFIRLGADITMKDRRGWNVLHLLASLSKISSYGNNVGHNLYETTKMLLRYKLSPNIKNLKGETALHLAVQKSNFHIIELLLDYGADASIQDKNGNTPLHLAVKKDSLEMVKLFLKYGANINLKNDRGLTPCSIAYFQHLNGNVLINNIFCIHIWKMCLVKKYVCSKNIKVLSSSDYFVKVFRLECDEEIRRLKKKIIGEEYPVSLYGILMREYPSRRPPMDKSLLKKLDLLKTYPILGELVQGKIQRMILTDTIYSLVWNRRLFHFSKLPEYCLDDIFRYLSDSDLGSLLRALETNR